VSNIVSFWHFDLMQMHEMQGSLLNAVHLHRTVLCRFACGRRLLVSKEHAMDLAVIEGDEGPRVQDIRLAEMLELGRARDIRQLIERNREELERHGPLRCHTAMAERPQGGGRVATEYWLNEPQAILLCMKSNAPRAEDVRSEIIAVFQAWRHGKLHPVQPPITLEAIGELFDAKLQPVHQEIAAIKGNVTFLARRVDDIVPRREFPEEIKRQWRHVIARRYAGECPCCRNVAIVDASGSSITGALHYDHYRGRELNGPADGWPVCTKCNLRLRDAEYKNASRNRFDVFHDDRRQIYAGHVPKQIRGANPGQGSLF
jgi:hypothetical protein